MRTNIYGSLIVVLITISCSLDNSENRIYFEERSDILEVDKKLGGDTYIHPLNVDMEIDEDNYIKVGPVDVVDFVWASNKGSSIAIFLQKMDGGKIENRLDTTYYHVYDYSNSEDFYSKYFNQDKNDTNKIVLKESYHRQVIYLENFNL